MELRQRKHDVKKVLENVDTSLLSQKQDEIVEETKSNPSEVYDNTGENPLENSNSNINNEGGTKINTTSDDIRILPVPQYCIAKWIILRMMGMIYFIAFTAAYYQNIGLMGQYGLQPVAPYMKRLHAHFANDSTTLKGFIQYPTIFWWIPVTDNNMNIIHVSGIILSTIVIALRVNSWLIQFILWLLYFSIVTVASGSNSFYAYGWESQILETGFLCMFLCTFPYYDKYLKRFRWCIYENKNDKAISPTAIQLWLFQWLCFRISLGAGLIKVRGSSCWTDKTCLYYHFETQPIPSPLSFMYHFAPQYIHRRMIDTDLIVQLYTSWFVLFPSCTALWVPKSIERVIRFIVRLGGFLQAGFMIGILLSGNFSVLNHLTIIPALACLDDECWPTTRKSSQQLRSNEEEIASTSSLQNRHHNIPVSRRLADALLLVIILNLSCPVIDNLLQRSGNRRQMMNASYDPFRLVNTYGAFGSVGTERYEPIVQISDDNINWYEIEFPCKPGNIYRRPCFCAPYHYRVDWNIWFIGFKPHQHYLRQRETWLFSLLKKIMEEMHVVSVDDDNNDKDINIVKKRPWLDLLDYTSKEYLITKYYKHNNSTAPKFAKVDMYRYEMAASLSTIMKQKLTTKQQQIAWWKRRFTEPLIYPISYESFS